VGAFHQPRLVLCDLDTLRTLPQREFRAGLGEVIKYGVISDAELFHKLELEMPRLLRLAPTVLAEIVARCCEIKADVVRQDETETGPRAILNFGHTIGHAIENSIGYGRYLHGEAIAIGQVAATLLSAVVARLSLLEALRICRLLAAAGLPTRLQLDAAQRKRLLAAMKLDKKVRDGQIRFVLADRIGQVRWGQQVPAELIQEVLSIEHS
jgi:3-dehydroquinate synthase